MKDAVTGTQMKQIDQDTIEGIGIPSVVLMERAAFAVADAAQGLALKKMKRDKKPIQFAVICGTGNNGADGIGAGRILWGRGYEVILYLAGDPQRSTPETYCRTAANSNKTSGPISKSRRGNGD